VSSLGIRHAKKDITNRVAGIETKTATAVLKRALTLNPP
jgi:hypothetical protein